MFTPSTAKFFFKGDNTAIYQDWENFKLRASFVWLVLNTPVTIKFGAK